MAIRIMMSLPKHNARLNVIVIVIVIVIVVNVLNTQVLTYSHLKAELPFACKIVCIPLPGRVICDIVRFSRAPSLLTPPVSKGSYLQLDDQMLWDRDSNTLLEIGGEPVQYDRLYQVAVNYQILQGVDDIVPLLVYLKQLEEQPPAITSFARARARSVSFGGDFETCFNLDLHSPLDFTSSTGTGVAAAAAAANYIDVHQAEDRALELKNLLVGYFSKMALYDMLVSYDFATLDLNGDGYLELDELVSAAKRRNPERDVSMLLLHNIMNISGSGSNAVNGCAINKIAKSDVLAMCIEIEGEIKFDHFQCHDHDLYSLDDFCNTAKHILGEAYDVDIVEQTFLQLDTDHSGFVSHRELQNTFVQQRVLDSLIV